MMENYCHDCAENYKNVAENVLHATLESGRKEGEVDLIAVTKTVAADAIAAVLEAGATIIGENRVQEITEKEEALSKFEKKVHMIGHLQSNKAKYLPGRVQMIQSIHSEKLAKAVNKEFAKYGKPIDVLIEVNIGEEDSKVGIAPAQLKELLYKVSELPFLKVKGLMTIPPICTELEARRYFYQMHQLFVDMKSEKIDNVVMQSLSMGMTNDYQAAILEGATMVRVGTGIFGKRI